MADPEGNSPDEPDLPANGALEILYAGRIAGTYAVAAGLWILFSDTIVDLIGWPILHTVKGLAFIAVSCAILYGYLRRKARRMMRVEQALKAAAESRSRLLSAVSHDLRQPLQSISLFASVIQGDPSLGPRSQEAADRMATSIDRMGSLLDSVLNIAKLDIGLVARRMQPVPLNSVFAQLADEMQPQAEAKGLTLRWVPTKAVVQTDPALLLTILRNLVTNAIRYTERGKILLGCRPRADAVAICVYDTGIGIAADKLDLVFEEFYQVGNPQRDAQLGLGLGLSIVRRLSRLLGHRVSVRSTLGKGSAFSVRARRVRGAR